MIMYNINRLLKDAGIDDGNWNLVKLYEAACFYAEMTGTPIPDHFPLFGKKAFTTAVGIHASAQEQAAKRVEGIKAGTIEPTEEEIVALLEYLEATVYTTVNPAEIGRHNEWQIGPLSGGANVRMWLKTRGLKEVNDKVMQAVLRYAKEKDRVLSDKEVFRLLRGLKAIG
jgi:2-isopropylmalate synthase